MREEPYKGCKIRSFPNTLADNTENAPYKYSINGVIQIDFGSHTIHIKPDALDNPLNIPDSEWKHFTENEADETFIKYAMRYIDSHSP